MTEPSALSTLEIVLTIAGLIFTVVSAFGGWVLMSIRDNIKAVRTSQDTQIAALQTDLAEIRSDLSAFKQHVPSVFVMRDDYIRTISTFDHKIDAMKDELQILNHQIGSLIGDRRREA